MAKSSEKAPATRSSQSGQYAGRPGKERRPRTTVREAAETVIRHREKALRELEKH